VLDFSYPPDGRIQSHFNPAPVHDLDTPSRANSAPLGRVPEFSLRPAIAPLRYHGAMNRLRQWAGAIRRDAVALYLAARDPRMPWPVKILAVIVAAYALSPIDLIPDVIPVIGLLDEVILLPLAIAGIVKLVPAGIMEEHRLRAEACSNSSEPHGCHRHRRGLDHGRRARRAMADVLDRDDA
jgi:uncharacterized membrane protein YkvA (DUF1232 family)